MPANAISNQQTQNHSQSLRHAPACQRLLPHDTRTCDTIHEPVQFTVADNTHSFLGFAYPAAVPTNETQGGSNAMGHAGDSPHTGGSTLTPPVAAPHHQKTGTGQVMCTHNNSSTQACQLHCLCTALPTLLIRTCGSPAHTPTCCCVHKCVNRTPHETLLQSHYGLLKSVLPCIGSAQGPGTGVNIKMDGVHAVSISPHAATLKDTFR